MNKTRLFTFGCSYTSWIDNPTWSDFIGINFDKYHNFGKPGASNTFIMQKLIEADELYNLNPHTDYIMIALTGFGRFSYLENRTNGGYDWQTNGDILFPNDGHPPKAKLISNEIYNWPWSAYDSWIATNIIKKLLTAKGIEHKIIMALDNSHYISDAFTLGLDSEFDNIGHIVPRIKDIYNLLDIKEPIAVYRESNMQTLYQNDNQGNHPSKQVYYDYCLKHMPELLSDKSLELLHTPNEIWKTKFLNLI